MILIHFWRNELVQILIDFSALMATNAKIAETIKLKLIWCASTSFYNVSFKFQTILFVGFDEKLFWRFRNVNS